MQAGQSGWPHKHRRMWLISIWDVNTYVTCLTYHTRVSACAWMLSIDPTHTHTYTHIYITHTSTQRDKVLLKPQKLVLMCNLCEFPRWIYTFVYTKQSRFSSTGNARVWPLCSGCWLCCYKTSVLVSLPGPTCIYCCEHWISCCCWVEKPATWPNAFRTIELADGRRF